VQLKNISNFCDRVLARAEKGTGDKIAGATGCADLCGFGGDGYMRPVPPVLP